MPPEPSPSPRVLSSIQPLRTRPRPNPSSSFKQLVIHNPDPTPPPDLGPDPDLPTPTVTHSIPPAPIPPRSPLVVPPGPAIPPGLFSPSPISPRGRTLSATPASPFASYAITRSHPTSSHGTPSAASGDSGSLPGQIGTLLAAPSSLLTPRGTSPSEGPTPFYTPLPAPAAPALVRSLTPTPVPARTPLAFDPVAPFASIPVPQPAESGLSRTPVTPSRLGGPTTPFHLPTKLRSLIPGTGSPSKVRAPTPPRGRTPTFSSRANRSGRSAPTSPRGVGRGGVGAYELPSLTFSPTAFGSMSFLGALARSASPKKKRAPGPAADADGSPRKGKGKGRRKARGDEDEGREDDGEDDGGMLPMQEPPSMDDDGDIRGPSPPLLPSVLDPMNVLSAEEEPSTSSAAQDAEPYSIASDAQDPSTVSAVSDAVLGGIAGLAAEAALARRGRGKKRARAEAEIEVDADTSAAAEPGSSGVKSASAIEDSNADGVCPGADPGSAGLVRRRSVRPKKQAKIRASLS